MVIKTFERILDYISMYISIVVLLYPKISWIKGLFCGKIGIYGSTAFQMSMLEE